MSNRFLSTRFTDLSDGSANIYVNRVTVRGLDPSQPVKTNGQGTLVSEKLDIADTQGLQAQLDGKLSNPLTADFDFQEYRGLRINEQQLTRKASGNVPPPGKLSLYAGVDGEFHQVDENGVDTVIGGDTFDQSLNTTDSVEFKTVTTPDIRTLTNTGYVSLTASDARSTMIWQKTTFPPATTVLFDLDALGQSSFLSNGGVWAKSFQSAGDVILEDNIEWRRTATTGFRMREETSFLNMVSYIGGVETPIMSTDSATTLWSTTEFILTGLLKPRQLRIGQLLTDFYNMPDARTLAPQSILVDLLGDGEVTWEPRNQWDQSLNTTNNVQFGTITATANFFQTDALGTVSIAGELSSPKVRSPGSGTEIIMDEAFVGVTSPLSVNATASAPVAGYALDVDGNAIFNGIVRATGSVDVVAVKDPAVNAFTFGGTGSGLNGTTTEVNIAVAGTDRIHCGTFATTLKGAPVSINDGANSFTLPQIRGGALEVLADVSGSGVLTWEPLTSLKPPPAFGEAYFNDNATPTTFLGVDTYTNVVGTRVAGINENFTVGAQNIVYTANDNRIVKVDVSVSWQAGGVLDQVYELAVHVNDVICPAGQVRSVLDTSATFPRCASVSCFANVSLNDFIGVKVRNKESTQSALIIDMSINIITLKDVGVSLNAEGFDIVDEKVEE
jgi:hypothetical protein